MGADEKIPRFEYLFRRTGGAAPGCHCTYCPLPLGASCSLNCGANYEKILAERAADGVKVTELTESPLPSKGVGFP